MCGIAGIWNPYEIKQHKLRETLKRMVDPLEHRGPDDFGIWNDYSNGIGLAHRRLSIQDLSKLGHQPMISPSGRFVITFNGEIYNHFDLRKELCSSSESKISWRGRSDTETLLSAIEFWPIEKVLNKMNGMFAFVVWDRENRNLILARDRFGEKPLYYGLIKNDENNNLKNFVFGSELSALKNFKKSLNEINTCALNTFFKYGYIPAPLSIYSGIRKLSPGHFLKIGCDKEGGFSPKLIPKETQWYNTKEVACEAFLMQKNYKNSKEVLHKLEETLSSSIKYQTISDVPIGTFLSGGIDSSLITALLQSQHKEPISTFTISFPDDNYGGNNAFNEAPYAKSVASFLGTNHNEVALTYREARNLIPKISKVFSEPFADSSQVPTHLVCSEAKKIGLSVMLSGDGGDELFGGYNRHTIAPLIYKGLSKLPNSLKYLIAKGIQKLPLKNSGLNQDKKQKLYQSIKNSSNIDEIYTALITIYSEENPLLNKDCIFNIENFSNNIKDSLSLSEQLMLKDVLNYLPSDLLVKLDRAAMNVSLETRTPFLDHRVAEMAWSLPLDFKIKGYSLRSESKWALREILKKYVPGEIVERKKAGFAMPIGYWLKGPLREWAEDLLDEKLIHNQGFLDKDIVKKLWEQHLNNKADNTSIIWSILMWQSWLNDWR